jgi:hypothetical protein
LKNIEIILVDDYGEFQKEDDRIIYIKKSK